MQYSKFLSLLIIFTSIFFISTAQAFFWPIFTPPTLDFLMKNDMVDTASCPAGEGKIKPSLVINIQKYLCRKACSPQWEWIANDQQSCHSLSHDFNFLGYEFNYVRDNSSDIETLYTTITAKYGNPNSAQPAFTFKFTSEKNDHWQCSEMSSEYHTVICSNDL